MRKYSESLKKTQIQKIILISLFLFYFISKHILIENNQKVFQSITLICDHYQCKI